MIEAAFQVRLGRHNIIEDDVQIRALSKSGVKTGDNVTIGRGSILICSGVVRWLGEGLEIGSQSAVGAQSFIAAQGGVVIGREVIMGPGVSIFSEDHIFSRTDLPIRSQGEARARVIIEDNCWIGSCVTILKGVRIGHGSVIAAGSVVTKDVVAGSLMAGVPAAFVRCA